ncbi:inter-alpha-trypsin inhibitor heavy chain H3 [Patella vulgata]|uniref:inter-alpha-trypsin inhibitor heavy chain H3 n=1 Tax=Patella vulgata TaxID=6465 RepID=UPI00217F478A|nr:inter-alpha-trypsin inhibitor heavy chain H3 [Patella vulgata]
MGLQSTYTSDGDPEFIVSVEGLHKSLCFKVEGQEGEIIRLVQDDHTGIRVNARLFGVNESKNTYISTVSIIRKNIVIIVKPQTVMVNREIFVWGNITAFLIRGHRVVLDENLMAVTFRRINVTAIVRRHVFPSIDETDELSYLGFYISDARGFSQYTHGLLGQFLYKRVSIDNLRYRNGRAKARLNVVSPLKPIARRAVATLGESVNRALNVTASCWMLRKNGRGVVDGQYRNYVVENMRDLRLLEF